MNLPKARTSGIIEQEADRELLIYDLRIDKAYTLNETSKIVYKACGKQTFEDLKRQYQFTDDLIYLTLDELSANNLIEDYQSNHFAGLSRREVIRKVGLATMVALPVIAGITAPLALNAASRLLANNQACTNDAQCASRTCTADRDFNLRCCVQTSDNNSPLTPSGFFQSNTQNACNSSAMRFCCSGMASFNSAGAGTCTCI